MDTTAAAGRAGRTGRAGAAVVAEVVATSTRSAGFQEWMHRWFDAWYEVDAAAWSHEREDPALESPDEVRAELAADDGLSASHLLLALGPDGGPRGAARIDLQLPDNTHVADVGVAVAPQHRRRGVGRLLLERACAVARAEGRTRLRGGVERPVDAATWPGSAACDRWGLPLGQTEARHRLELPVPPQRLVELETAALPHAAGYRVRTWAGPCADADVDALAALTARMSTDAPTGDLHVEPETWDAARLRAAEARAAAQGRRSWTALAEDAAGRAVGFTQLVQSRHEPHRLQQWDTLVLREHRGHRLGTLLKIAALRAATADAPAARHVTTWNAAENRPMIAVNEAMGYRLDELVEAREAPLEDVETALRAR
ncbi:GNAT family N-acetyltransferase [Kineococcus xinjiangensis]|uniref:GNAT family N-acetyltransferase n=1 Tax=Kineococcus xinjiangensis TaxID=512762 RepID=UPI000CECC025|nr:GNAT family N-acetyltransferase [Kineococcus xinjiangensis]